MRELWNRLRFLLLGRALRDIVREAFVGVAMLLGALSIGAAAYGFVTLSQLEVPAYGALASAVLLLFGVAGIVSVAIKNLLAQIFLASCSLAPWVLMLYYLKLF